jgi:hypothetical protein
LKEYLNIADPDWNRNSVDQLSEYLRQLLKLLKKLEPLGLSAADVIA